MVHGYDLKPERRLFDFLKGRGLQANQDVTFLTDGREESALSHRSRQSHLSARARLVLHRHAAGVLEQYARGAAHHDEAESKRLLKTLSSIKWLLWHGNQHRAQQEIGNI